MDNSDHYPSKLPIKVNIASGAEPVDCDGFFSERNDGFVLEFGTPSADYVITHGQQKTTLSASGVLSYVLDFSEGGETKISTVLGGINISLVPIKRVVDQDGAGVRLDLAYKIIGADETIRAVKIDARFLR